MERAVYCESDKNSVINNNSNSDAEDKNKYVKLSFKILGMTCATCAKNVERALNRVEDVSFVAVNLATETAFVIAEEGVTFEVLKQAVAKAGYEASQEASESIEQKRYQDTKRALFWALVITLPLSIAMILHMLGFYIPYFEVIEFVAGGVVVFYAGRSIIRGAWIALSHFHTNMDVLIFLGATASWLTAGLALLGVPIVSFGAIGAMIVALHITGRYIESRLRDKATKEIRSLIKLQAREARAIVEDKEVMVPIDAVKENFLVLVKPGERIPVDGVIEEGVSSVDESMITGEAIPVAKEKGSFVTGGSINLTGPIKVLVTKVGDDTFLSKMIELVQDAQGAKVPLQALADRITLFFVPTIVFLALLASLLWYFNGDIFYSYVFKIGHILPWIAVPNDPISSAIFVLVATLVIACPCALGLATPMALVAAAGEAYKLGLIIRNAEAIQTIKDIGVIVTDKTGTLTEGNPVVTYYTVPEDELKIVAAAERQSNHPLAKAISALEKTEVEVKGLEERTGEGIFFKYQGNDYKVGKPEVTEAYSKFLEEGKTVVEVWKNGKLLGFIVIEDPIRSDSKEAVQALYDEGITIVMATGDNPITARAVADRLGIKEVKAGVHPKEKLDIIRFWQKTGKKVMMAGDGMNDAAALKGADVGVAIGSGADLAIDSADIVIVKGGLSKVAKSILLSRKTFKVIGQNLFWAFLYNIVAIPMAMAGMLHPAIAEVAMAMSSISVVLNSLRIKGD